MTDDARESLITELIDLLSIEDSEDLLLSSIPKQSDDEGNEAFERFQLLVQLVSLASSADNDADKCDILNNIKRVNQEFKIDFPQMGDFESACVG